jgi:hypothetical protein
MLHSHLFPEHDCNGELIELPDRCTEKLTVTRCDVCWTELSWRVDEPSWVTVVYPGMKRSMDWRT